MALAIATNTGALMAAASATSVNKDMETSMERLSTGKRINSAKDDAAGVAIASRLSSEIRGTNQAIRNAQDGQALINTAEGAHKEIETILQRMRELAVQSSNDTNDSTDRSNLQAEFSALTTEINRIAGATTWAGQELLTGAGGSDGDGAFNLQVGGNTGTVDTITVTISGMTTSDLGEDTEVEGSVSTDGVDVVVEETQVTNVAIDLDNVATVGDTTVLNIGSTAITYNAVGAGEDLATIVAGLNAAATTANYSTATFSAGSDGASIDVTYADPGVQTDSITLAATDVVTAAVTTTGAIATTGVTGVAEVQTGDLSGVTFTGAGAIDAAISLTIGTSTFTTTGTSFADAAAIAADLNSVGVTGYTVSASTTNLILTATATGAVTDSFALSGGGTDSTAVAAAAFTETTAGVTAAEEVQNAALVVANVAGIGDTVALTIGSDVISYTTVAAGEELGTIISGLTTAAAAASYTTATFSIGSDLASIDVTYAAAGVSGDSITLAATDGATAAVSTTGTSTTTGVTGVTAVAQISSVDASSFEVEEGDVFTMVVGDVTLTYTASSSDTSISDVVTGLQTDDDYDSTVFTLTESSDTITATYATAEAQDDTTITIGKNLFDISDRDQATAMIDMMDEAIALVNTQRAELGAVSNRLDNTVSNLTSISINLEGGRGRIEDADFAAESTSLAKSQILQQASTAMLAQANASKQSVLSLLQG
jgi:flagellin